MKLKRRVWSQHVKLISIAAALIAQFACKNASEEPGAQLEEGRAEGTQGSSTQGSGGVSAPGGSATDTGQTPSPTAQAVHFAESSGNLSPPFASNTSVFDSVGAGVAIFDFDKDGRLDIFVTNNANPTVRSELLRSSLNPDGAGVPNSLYRNVGVDAQGHPRFVDVARSVGLADRFAIGYAAVAADFDNDGDDDLYVANGLKGVPMSVFGRRTGHEEIAKLAGEGSSGQIEKEELIRLARQFSHPDLSGFRDEGGITFPPLVNFDVEGDALNGEFVVRTDPATGRSRGEGRNTLYRNMLTETGEATFVDVTEKAGQVGGTHQLPGGRHSTIASVADVDRDGLLDIFVGNYLDPDFWAHFRATDREGKPTTDGSNLLFNGEKWELYRNNGDMTFTDVTESAGLLPSESPFVFDMTGRLRPVYDPNLRDAAGKPVGENFPHVWSSGFTDYDKDGDQDLWIAADVPGHVYLFRNDTVAGGQIKYTEISRVSGMQTIGDWTSITFGDFDEDLDMDILAGNFGSTRYLVPESADPTRQLMRGTAEYYRWNRYPGQGHGLFRNDGVRTLLSTVTGTTKSSTGQTQVDQLVSAVIPAFPSIAGCVLMDPNAIMPPLMADPRNVVFPKPILFGIESVELILGSAAFDFDNDTHLDIYSVGSYGGAFGDFLPNPGRLLRGDGKNRFTDIGVEARVLNIAQASFVNVEAGRSPLPEDRLSLEFVDHGKAVASGDLNNDGFMDIFVTNIGGFDSTLPGTETLVPGTPTGMGTIQGVLKKFTAGQAKMFINEKSDNTWLKVELVGARSSVTDPHKKESGTGEPVPDVSHAQGSNRSAIGALVIAHVDDAKVGKRSLMREVSAGNGHQAMHSLIQHFGLGDIHMITRLEVRWPSGLVQEFANIGANQTIRIHEGVSAIEHVPPVADK